MNINIGSRDSYYPSGPGPTIESTPVSSVVPGLVLPGPALAPSTTPAPATIQESVRESTNHPSLAEGPVSLSSPLSSGPVLPVSSGPIVSSVTTGPALLLCSGPVAEPPVQQGVEAPIAEAAEDADGEVEGGLKTKKSSRILHKKLFGKDGFLGAGSVKEKPAKKGAISGLKALFDTVRAGSVSQTNLSYMSRDPIS